MKATQIFTAVCACVLLIHHLPGGFGDAWQVLLAALAVDFVVSIFKSTVVYDSDAGRKD